MAHESGPRDEAQPAGTAQGAAVAVAQEKRLVEAVLRKDRKATAEFVAAHSDAVYAFVRHRMAPRVERVDDVVQEVFLAALAGLAGFRSQSSLRSWLLGIARHKIEDYYRQLLRDPAVFDDTLDRDDPADDRPSIEDRIDRARAAERTKRILSTLPERYRVVLLWRYWENRSVREIAQMTAKTDKSIERLLARAKARFREMWEVQP
jgi:RNA polymerase sigma-70 factor (ECF subfamily)